VEFCFAYLYIRVRLVSTTSCVTYRSRKCLIIAEEDMEFRMLRAKRGKLQ